MSGMHVAGIWRYPVKSFEGEGLEAISIDPDGVRGDRSWGVRDEETGKILTGRREPQLLFASASVDTDGEPHGTLPDGTTWRGVGADTDAALSAWLERPVTLVDARRDSNGGRAEFFADATDDSSRAIEWTMPAGRYVDNMPLLVVTTASLRTASALHPTGTWDVRRFRPNLLIDGDGDGWLEDGWCHRSVRIGDAELVPREPCVRCTMVTRPQPDLERDLDIYKTIARHHGGTFGVWTEVRTPGAIRVGDAVEIDGA